jgi:cellobiose phosphorylase
MAGVFHSMVTQGHVSINRLLSTTHSYLSLFRTHGLRIFVELAEDWHLLDVPSAYEMTPSGCRWLYRHADGMLEVRSSAATERHELGLTITVLSGSSRRFLISNHVAINGDNGIDAVPVRFGSDDLGISVYPIAESDVGRRFPDGSFRIEPLPGTSLEQVGGDELLYADGRSRQQPFLCLITAPAESVGFRLTGKLIEETETDQGGPDADTYWTQMTAGLRMHPPVGSPLAEAAAGLGEILPWYAHNALIHYLAPRGLEQYSGGGWGTRDVAQGPVELLLALGRDEPIRDLLLRLYRNQNADGDWPQWFMFFDRERNIRPDDSHGDIVFWPVLALAQYLLHADDAALLDEPVAFFHPEGEAKAERATLWHHVERALQVIDRRRIAGTRLAAYGHGDWNDSLQPVDPAMRENLCSAWTVTLHHQTLTTLSSALRRLGHDERAAQMESMAAEVLADFKRLLLVDDVLAGFAYFHGDGRIDYLLHPRDRDTGISYSLLAMIHAITNGMLTPEQAKNHFRLIETHLLGPEGARLFDRPLEYRGGLQRYFQRAESSSFFGREIGLMYTHAHLRYAESLAHYGDADGFFRVLCQANPIAIRELVPSAAPRQANCYYSSSDAAFVDRYQAFKEYNRALQGEIPLEGGWRVYSSGAGIATSLILRGFLGLRRESSRLVVDPVMPKALDGLRIEVELWERPVEVVYRIGERGCGTTAIQLNGLDLPFTRSPNPYRTGAAVVSMAEVRQHLKEGANRLLLQLE